MDELALVNHIRALAGKNGPGIIRGIGDDCAIFRPRANEDLLFTADQLIEGIHFHADAGAENAGYRALARGLSDIAAMGGDPRFCLVSLALPHARGTKWIDGFYRGLLALARRTRTVLAGGDLAHAPQIYCDVMVCGSVPRGKALTRDGARPGDAIYVSGALGRPWERTIVPRLDIGRQLRGRATACIDISDGISLDLYRLCAASRVAAELEQVPCAPRAGVQRALHGGEDYELLFTLPPRARPPRGAIRVGTILKGKPRVRFQGHDLPPAGYNHFSSSPK
jgi:thiamine-monophosphate kinase